MVQDPRRRSTDRKLADTTTVPPTVLAARVGWLIRLRWFVAAAVAAVGAVVWTALVGATHGAAILSLAGFIAASNVLFLHLLGRCRLCPVASAPRCTTRLTNTIIAVDVVVLAVLLHFAGGAMNPLAAAIVFQIAVAASLLSRRDAYVQAVLAGVLFLAVATAEVVAGIRFSLFGLDTADAARSLLWAGTVAAAFLAVLLLTVFLTQAILERLRRINRRLMDANRELSALDLTKSRFLHISSLELRGPLAAIHAMLSAMGSAGTLSDKQEALIGRIHKRTEEVMAQLDEMTLLSSIQESGAETSRTGPVDVNESLAAAVRLCADEAGRRGLTLTLQTNGTTCVSAWQDALAAVFENIVGNAVRYTPDAGSVTVSAHREGRHVEVEVTDTGIGIPPEEQDKVFTEFFRGTRARQVGGGTGLGLSIARAVVERLGGRISLVSSPETGTTVRIRLPLAPETLPPGGDASEQQEQDKEPHRSN